MKDELIELIEAFATARASDNTLLQRLVAERLTELLNLVDLVPVGSAQPWPTASEFDESAEEGGQGLNS